MNQRHPAGPPMTLGNMREARGAAVVDLLPQARLPAYCIARRVELLGRHDGPELHPSPEVQRVRRQTCRCPAELEGAAATREPDGQGMAMKRQSPFAWEVKLHDHARRVRAGHRQSGTGRNHILLVFGYARNPRLQARDVSDVSPVDPDKKTIKRDVPVPVEVNDTRWSCHRWQAQHETSLECSEQFLTPSASPPLEVQSHFLPTRFKRFLRPTNERTNCFSHGVDMPRPRSDPAPAAPRDRHGGQSNRDGDQAV